MNIISTYKPEDNHNIIIQYPFRQIKTRYPKKIMKATLRKHMGKYYPFSSIAQNDPHFRHKDKRILISTINHLPFMKNHSEIREDEDREESYKFFKIDDLTKTAWNSITNIHLLQYKNYIPKPMLATRLIQLIDRESEKYIDWGCKKIAFVKIVCVKPLVILLEDMFFINYIAMLFNLFVNN